MMWDIVRLQLLEIFPGCDRHMDDGHVDPCMFFSVRLLFLHDLSENQCVYEWAFDLHLSIQTCIDRSWQGVRQESSKVSSYIFHSKKLHCMAAQARRNVLVLPVYVQIRAAKFSTAHVS